MAHESFSKKFQRKLFKTHLESQVEKERNTNGMKGLVTKRGPDFSFELLESFPETDFLKVHKKIIKCIKNNI